ncbi:hypothetical protein [Flavobacterium sp.]|uniref:hypothetical protein n=1 Tax=Flavobacterium sp. TaxID=239 RepID=UPI003A94D88B
MKQALKLLLLATFALLTGCNNSSVKPIDEEKGFDYGRIRNEKYSNTFFNLEMNVPKNWHPQNKEEIKELTNEGRKIVAGGNENTEARIKASEINTASLLVVFKYDEEDDVMDYNANFMLVAENIKNATAIKTGEQYLNHAQKLIMGSALAITEIDKEFEKRTINGIDFYQMNMTVDIEGIPVYQTYLVTIENNFALSLIYSYLNEEQKNEIEEKAINTIKHKK